MVPHEDKYSAITSQNVSQDVLNNKAYNLNPSEEDIDLDYDEDSTYESKAPSSSFNKNHHIENIHY